MSNIDPKDSSALVLQEAVTTDLYSKLLQQLQKDMIRAGIDYTIPATITPEVLVVELCDLVQQKMRYHFNEYLNFLYAVDVSEQEVKKCTSEDVEDIAIYVTSLILKREWKKVYYRNRL